MFSVALLTIAKTWKQPKCSSTDEWVKKMWGGVGWGGVVVVCVLEYYSAIEKEILAFVTIWINLEDIMLSEISQRKTKHYDFTYIWNLKKLNS